MKKNQSHCLALFRFRMVAVAACLAVLASTGVAEELSSQTALDRYVAKSDGSYSWKLVSNHTSQGMRTLVVELVSQTWRTKEDVNRTVWKHWLTMAIPEKVRSDVALLWISGGGNGGDPPAGPPERIQAIARATGTVVAELKMVPNQPLVFHNDGERRTEDDLVAYTWDQYLKTGDETWPARNPMVKSAVRAMDTITEVTSTDKSDRKVTQFVVAGASKRGWTTWLTGAVDKRVIGIVPIVIDILNVKANTHHHFSAYGFWAPSVGDYVEHRIIEHLKHPRMPELLKLVDPWYYRHRLTMPKLILNAAGDQFFPPDSSQYYFDDLVGQKHLRYVPNTDHGLGGSDALETLIAWYSLVVSGKPAPEVSWRQTKDAIHVTAKDKPLEVRLWQATNPHARDFRLETLGPKYTSQVLKPQTDGSYLAKLEKPEEGWTAYFVELTYDVGAPTPLKVTTPVRVVPDVLPFEGVDYTKPPSITLQCLAPNPEFAAEIEEAANSSEAKSIASDIRHWVKTKGQHTIVTINWIPVGRFEESADTITDWLKEQGCRHFVYRLESGRLDKPPFLPLPSE